jgi:hypothetical protein
MHPSLTQNTLDFHNAQSASPLPCKNTGSKNNEQTKSEEKRLDKQRDDSPSTSSAVKPPYSYIALSNYHHHSLN